MRIFQDWRDEQSQQTYPFHDHALLTRFDGEVLPLGLILDALLHAPNSSGGYYLAAIEIAEETTTFIINDETDSQVAYGEWSPRLPDTSVIPLITNDNPQAIEGLPAGVLVIRREVLEGLQIRWGIGRFDIQQSTATFVPATWEYVFVDVPEDSVGIIGVDGVNISATGDLYLVAENGVRMVCEDDNTIRVHAIGDPLANRKKCGDTLTIPRYIRELVFQHNDETVICSPGPSGEAWIIVTGADGQDSALRMYNDPGAISFGFAAKPN